MRTGFVKGSDDSKWMDPAVVARIIWDLAAAQTKSYEVINILRQPDGSPRVVDGPRCRKHRNGNPPRWLSGRVFSYLTRGDCLFAYSTLKESR